MVSILFDNQNSKNSKRSKLLFCFYGQISTIDTKKMDPSYIVYVIEFK